MLIIVALLCRFDISITVPQRLTVDWNTRGITGAGDFEDALASWSFLLTTELHDSVALSL